MSFVVRLICFDDRW